ncbi:TonB-dependent receptor [Nitrospirillum amazonense]|uniref:TonB-dependent receptor n=1 Tax=Nitrospirillum amazonense TaxID=28077 RepID=A0A560FA42_9PROT|nr:TonB-dependent receptor [Nitrospirillum amazonense]TWB18464.1 TonB-dependent receptor [Nitrospirillum amazonense]
MFKSLRPMLLCGAASAVIAFSAPAVAQTRSFDLPAQPAVSAIPAFAKQAGIQIVAPAGQLDGISTQAIHGELDRKKALATLLQGTPLVVSSDDGAVVVLQVGTPAKAPVTAPKPQARVNDDPLEEVVVTSFRESLAQAKALKREAVGSEEVIVAEDIAAFPDLNLAESLQRVPGVTINRDSGEGRQITLRGLGPDFTRTQLNGMEVLGNTASGMDNRGAVSRTRSFDYSLFASELFDRVTVEKSYAAEQDEGGIGGTVGLSTAKPFDYDGFKAVFSAKGQNNSNTDSVTPRMVGLLSNRWGDFGALVSVAYSTNDSNEYGYRNWGWSQIKVNPANIGPGVSAADAAKMESGTIYAPQADTYSTWFDHRTRLGSTLALQYEPENGLKLGFDALYSRLTNDRKDYAMAAGGTNALTGNVSGTQVLQSAVIQGNTLVAANYTGVDMRNEYNTESDSTEFYQTVLHGSDQITDRLLVKGMVGYSRSDYELPYFDKVFLEAKNQGIGFDDRTTMPVNTYGFNTTDPSLWNLMRLDTQANKIVNSYKNAKLDFEYALTDSSTIKTGFEYKRFEDEGAQYNNKVFYNVPADRAIPASTKYTVPYDTLVPYIVGDVDAIYKLIGQTRDIENAKFLSPGSDYHVTEDTKGGYIQYDLDTDVMERRLKANVGLRYYSTDLTSAGSVNSGGVLKPVTVPHTYSGVLPAANLAYFVEPDLVARLSANRNISRPALSDLQAAGTITTAPFGGSLTIGNPDLKPFTADAVEGSLEYYDGKVGFVSIGAFYKKLNSFISATTVTEPYSATGYPLSFLLPGQTGATPYNVSQPVNVSGASIKGVEVAVQRDFDFLPAPFNHLGMVANGTFADGSSPAIINGKSYDLPLVNLSRFSANATLYYETETWGVRISEAYRSQYLDSIGGNGNVGEAYEPTNNVDFSAHYNVTPHVKVTLEGLNLTDEHIVQFTDLTAHRIEVNTSSGRTFLWGVTCEF